MAKLYFVRHGQSTSNVLDVFAGARDDILLTPQGIRQAEQAGHYLEAKKIHFDRFIASPLFRTQRTAHIIADIIHFNHRAIETDSRLKEYDTGSLTGKPRAGVTSHQLVTAPQAEDPDQFAERVKSLLDELTSQPKTILLVSHSGVARVITCLQKGLSPASFFDLPDCPNATVLEL